LQSQFSPYWLRKLNFAQDCEQTSEHKLDNAPKYF